MKWLGIDIGSKNIGVATSDEGEVIASPYGVLPRCGNVQDAKAIIDLARHLGAEGVVIGMPLDLSGKKGTPARLAQSLGEVLGRSFSGPIAFYDERFSTAAAQRLLIEADMRREKRKKVVDKVAAAIILQGFLDRRRSVNGGNS